MFIYSETVLSSSWSDYYNVDIEERYEHKEFTSDNETLRIDSENTYVICCFFHDMHSTSNGGAVIYEKDDSNVLIEKCSFFNCSSDASSGAICITGGNSILSFICGCKCFAAVSESFCCVDGKYTRKTNSVFYSSISLCKSNTTDTLSNHYGFIKTEYINISHNIAKSRSGIYFGSNEVDVITGFGIIVSLSLLKNNTASNQCARLANGYNTNCKHQMKNMIII